jgi:uncharacterized protein (TIGR00162 family)
MNTCVNEGKVQPNRPVIIEGLPGLGSLGMIVTSYLIKQSKAKRIAVLHSPHFPYYALVDGRGVARLPRNEFYYCKSKDGNKEIVMITGDCQPQSPAGQYEVAEKIVEYAVKHSARLVITVGGYSSSETDRPKVVGAATSGKLSTELTKLGVVINKLGIPVVGVAGLILPLAESRGLDAVCLLGETVGYVPDPKAAKSVLTVLSQMLDLELDYGELENEMKRMSKLEDKIRQAAVTLDKEIGERKLDERFSYIS